LREVAEPPTERYADDERREYRKRECHLESLA
jgi:hypothetical protein